MAIELFISYHEADEQHLRALVTALKPLERGAAKSSLWHRGLARAGEEVEALAARRFETARVIVLLLSNDYLAEDRLYDEATLALQRQREGSARVVPIVVRPCNLEETALGGMATLPKGTGTISTAANVDEAWTKVAGETGAVLKEVAAKAQVQTPAVAASEPRYRDEATRELGRRLQDTLSRRDQLLDEGRTDAALMQEIADIKRRLREEGQLKAGDVLGERPYKLIERIGSGGFADVWRAKMGAGGREVAVKVLHANLAGDPERVERFFRGARAMARLRHPGIVRILEQHGEDRGWHYFVMELVRGKNLRDAVLAGEVTQDQISRIVLAVGEALADAHRRGVVHRDVKPANILLDETGTSKLTDFDLVAVNESTAGTRTGAMGTFVYAAPELMHQPRNADARADVFGLGMTAIFCWYGRELPVDMVRTPEKFLSALACERAVRQVLSASINWEPEQRHKDASTFCEALRQARSKKTRLDTLLSWVEIPAGEFIMGSPAEDTEARGDERPQRRIGVDAFALSRTPITVGQYAAVMSKDPGDTAPDLPVTNVSWLDAIHFCNSLSELAGRTPCYMISENSLTWIRRANGFRLPTEIEWEYACRAGTTTRYSCGDAPNLLHDFAWLDENSEDQAHSVEQKRPNPWGLHDMIGNVWEWVWDVHRSYAQLTTEEDETFVALPPRDVRVVRGGSFRHGPWALRSAYRGRSEPGSRFTYIGFRCAAPGRRQR